MAAGLEDGIISLLAPPWNGARSAEAIKSHHATTSATSVENSCITVVPNGQANLAFAGADSAHVIATS